MNRCVTCPHIFRPGLRNKIEITAGNGRKGREGEPHTFGNNNQFRYKIE